MIRYLNQIFTAWVISYGEYLKGFSFKMYQPKGDVITNRAVIIYYHAGGGTIEDGETWCTDFVKMGYVTVSAEYKKTVGQFTEELQKQAVINTWNLIKYLSDNAAKYGIDKNRIFQMGTSAGAITALQSGIGLNDRENPYFKGAFPAEIPIVTLGTASISGSANSKFQALINPGDPPNSFYNGEKDKTIPYSTAVDTFNMMVKVGVSSKFMGFPTQGHKLKSHEIILPDLTNFFYNILYPKK